MPRPPRAYKTQHPKKRAFLLSYEQHGYVGRAAADAGVHRCTFYDWLAVDTAFAADVEMANWAVLERFEREADRRAIEGVDHPITYQGVVTGHYAEYSDNLLMFRMKALAPDKYRERQSVEHSGPNSGPIRVEDAGLTDEERASRVMAILERARARRDRSVEQSEGNMGTASGTSDSSLSE